MMDDRLYRVTEGGLFHLPKVKYSSETADLLKELIRESKLSIFQRKELEKAINNGDPLPLPPNKTALGKKKKIVPLERLDVQYFLPRRRKLDAIKQSGAFDRDAIPPSFKKANHDIEKKKLQEVMAYGRTLKSGIPNKKPLNEDEVSNYDGDEDEENSREVLLREIMQEIKEKNDFLQEMEALGHGKKYRDVIEQEIARKLKLIEEVNDKFNKLEIK